MVPTFLLPLAAFHNIVRQSERLLALVVSVVVGHGPLQTIGNGVPEFEFSLWVELTVIMQRQLASAKKD